MPWYYVEDGQQAGPISESEFEAIVASGRVSPETLVWKEGMENWETYSQVRSSAMATAGLPATPTFDPSQGFGATTPSYGLPGTAGGTIQCNECGRYSNEGEVIRYGTMNVCASCKPGFVQRIKEGGRPVAGEMDYAGFWIRFAAKFLDGLIGTVVGFVLGFVAALVVPGDAAELVSQLLGIAFGICYYVYFHGKFGATPGKMALRLKVVRSDGSDISFGTAIGRYFSEILSSLILLIGYIMAAFDEEKRALHDRICDTRVIRV